MADVEVGLSVERVIMAFGMGEIMVWIFWFGIDLKDVTEDVMIYYLIEIKGERRIWWREGLG